MFVLEYSVVLVSTLQHSESAITYVPALLDFFPITVTTGHYRVLCARRYVLLSYLCSI